MYVGLFIFVFGHDIALLFVYNPLIALSVRNLWIIMVNADCTREQKERQMCVSYAGIVFHGRNNECRIIESSIVRKNSSTVQMRCFAQGVKNPYLSKGNGDISIIIIIIIITDTSKTSVDVIDVIESSPMSVRDRECALSRLERFWHDGELDECCGRCEIFVCWIHLGFLLSSCFWIGQFETLYRSKGQR